MSDAGFEEARIEPVDQPTSRLRQVLKPVWNSSPGWVTGIFAHLALLFSLPTLLQGCPSSTVLGVRQRDATRLDLQVQPPQSPDAFGVVGIPRGEPVVLDPIDPQPNRATEQNRDSATNPQEEDGKQHAPQDKKDQTSSSEIVDDNVWGHLTGRFVYVGTPPKPKLIRAPPPPNGPGALLDESLLVNPKNGGVANIMIYAVTKNLRTH
ncbi:MAG: hypothetical protein N2C14_09215, partial [Planctomycetales bacterium]